MKHLIYAIISEFQEDGVTKRDWVLAFICAIAFVLLTGIAGALE